MRDANESSAGPARRVESGEPVWVERLEAHREIAGTVSDRELAVLAGVSTSAARNFRARLGRPATRRSRAARPPDPQPGTNRLPPLAPQTTDRPAQDVIAENVDRLDTLPDWMLARELRVSVVEIEAFRVARARPRSLPPAPPDPPESRSPRRNRSRPSTAPPSNSPRSVGTDERIAAVAHLVGKVADIHVALAAGVSVAEVVAWRKKHQP